MNKKNKKSLYYLLLEKLEKYNLLMTESNPLITNFFFNNKKYPITIQSKDWLLFSRDTYIALLKNNQIDIPSDISPEVFQSFIKYFEDGELPAIQQNNIDEYAKLNKIFQISSFDTLIQAKQDYYTQSLNNINSLNDDSILDKSDIENKISQLLDDYILNYGEYLIKTPVQSLFNIITNPNCRFTLHNDFYELIKSNYNQTHDPTKFALIQFLDGNLITRQNLCDSIRNKSFHLGFVPNFDFSLFLPIENSISTEKVEIIQKDLTFKLDPLFLIM